RRQVSVPVLTLGTAKRLQKKRLQKRERFSFAMLDLVHRALPGRLVGTEPHDLGSVPETVACEMVVGHFHNNLRVNRFPFGASFGTPPTRPTRGVTGKSRRFL